MITEQNVSFGLERVAGTVKLRVEWAGYVAHLDIDAADYSTETAKYSRQVYDEDTEETTPLPDGEYERLILNDDATAIVTAKANMDTFVGSSAFKTWACNNLGLTATEMSKYKSEQTMATALGIELAENESIRDKVDKPIFGLPDGSLIVDKTVKEI